MAGGIIAVELYRWYLLASALDSIAATLNRRCKIKVVKRSNVISLHPVMRRTLLRLSINC